MRVAIQTEVSRQQVRARIVGDLQVARKEMVIRILSATRFMVVSSQQLIWINFWITKKGKLIFMHLLLVVLLWFKISYKYGNNESFSYSDFWATTIHSLNSKETNLLICSRVCYKKIARNARGLACKCFIVIVEWPLPQLSGLWLIFEEVYLESPPNYFIPWQINKTVLLQYSSSKHFKQRK